MRTTQTVAEAIAARPEGQRPVLIQASGIARYGTVANPEPCTEDDLAAADFLAQVAVQWEAPPDQAAEAGARTVVLRTSPVMDRSGGAFAPMKLAWSAGLGAMIGSGRQHMPMISLDDYLGVVQWAADTSHAAGPYNLTLPVPTTNAEFTDELARQLHRPRVLKVPAVVLRTAARRAQRSTARRHLRGARAAAGRRIPVLLPRRLGDDRPRRSATVERDRRGQTRPHEPGLQLPRAG